MWCESSLGTTRYRLTSFGRTGTRGQAGAPASCPLRAVSRSLLRSAAPVAVDTWQEPPPPPVLAQFLPLWAVLSHAKQNALKYLIFFSLSLSCSFPRDRIGCSRLLSRFGAAVLVWSALAFCAPCACFPALSTYSVRSLLPLCLSARRFCFFFSRLLSASQDSSPFPILLSPPPHFFATPRYTPVARQLLLLFFSF